MAGLTSASLRSSARSGECFWKDFLVSYFVSYNPAEHPRNLLSIQVAAWPLHFTQLPVSSIACGLSRTLVSLTVLVTVCLRNEEAGGSNPLSSTNSFNNLHDFWEFAGVAQVAHLRAIQAQFP